MILLAFVLLELNTFPFEVFGDIFLMGMLFISGLIAFFLNIAVVLLISNTSALVLTIGGIAKDVLLVVLSLLIFTSPVSLLQVFGYSISLTGMNLYKNFKTNPEKFTNDTFTMFHNLINIAKCQFKFNKNPVDNDIQNENSDTNSLLNNIEITTPKSDQNSSKNMNQNEANYTTNAVFDIENNNPSKQEEKVPLISKLEKDNSKQV